MVKVILFDFWGTLVEQGIWSPVKQVKNILQIDLPFHQYITRMEKSIMTQKFSTLTEAFQNLCDEFQIKPDKKLIEELVGLWNKSWMLAKPYPEVIEEIKKLKEKYQIVLVSNTDCFSINHVLDKFDLKELFDNLFLSYNLNSIKTDKYFFQNVLKELNLNPEDCVMVGDSIQSDIISAKRNNIKAILMDRKDRRSNFLKIKDFTELGKLI